MRCSGSIVSTVAMKLAKGPASISTLVPSLKTFWRQQRVLSVTSEHETRDKLKGKRLWFAVKADKLETPIVLLIVRHGASSVLTLTNM